MSTPWLSVVVPTFRGERYLRAALASVAVQRDPDIECLLVDDGSDDGTLAIARSFERDIPLRFVEGPKRRNWVATTNAGLAAAAGRFACFLHQDDAFRPGRFAAIRRAIDRHRDVRLLVHATRFVDEEGRPLGTWHCPLPADSPIDSSIVVSKLLVQNFIAIPSPVFRTADARSVGALDEALWYTADWDFWLRLARLGPTVYLDEPLSDFRIHGESQTMTRSKDAAAFREQLLRVLERYGGDADESTRRIARLAIETNVALAALAHGERPDVAALLRWAPGSPAALARFVQDSRIVERVSARVRLRLRDGIRGLRA